MKRSPMKPGKGFARPVIERKKRAPIAAWPFNERPAAVLRRADGKDRMSVPVPKENALQHEGYMGLVRKLPCAHCKVIGFTQFCHSDMNKGQGIKTDCRRGWPGCGPHFDSSIGEVVPGCHWLLGSTGQLGKQRRRELEDEYAAQAREAILTAGKWPASLPKWED